MTRDETIDHARQADEIGNTAKNGRYFNAAVNLNFQPCTCGAEHVARASGCPSDLHWGWFSLTRRKARGFSGRMAAARSDIR